MVLKKFLDVCRLCGEENGIISIFEKNSKLCQDVQHIICVTTGVQITPEDAITQKVCINCSYFVLKMYKFRNKSLMNDCNLKEKWAKYQRIFNVLTNRQTSSNIITPKPVNREENDSNIGNIIKENRNISVKHKKLTDTLKCNNIVAPIIIRRDTNISVKHKKLTDTVKGNNIVAPISIRRDTNISVKHKKITDTVKGNNIVAPISIRRDTNTSVKHLKLTDTLNGNNIVAPISLRRDSQNSTYVIVNKRKDQTDRIDQKPTKSIKPIKETTESSPLNERKRKSVLNDDTPPIKKQAFFEALNLKPDITSVEKVDNLVTCNICQSVYYNDEELNTHKLEHFRCQFCKTQFDTDAQKHEHFQTCIIKNKMDNPPCVDVSRIDTDTETRKRSVEFPSISDLEENEIIVIDDEEDEQNDVLIVDGDSNMSFDSDEQNSHSQNTELFDENTELPVTLKPDISLENNTILNDVSSATKETKVLKKILNNREKTRKKFIQTEPGFFSVAHSQNSVANLENLKNQLHAFTIPVEIKYGPSFHVSFCHTQENKKKKFHAWDDLTVNDIQISTASKDTDNENNTIQSIYTSGPSSPRTASNSTSISFDYNEPSNIDKTLGLDTDLNTHSSSDLDSETSEASHTQEIREQKFDACDDLIANDIQMATASENTDNANNIIDPICNNRATSPKTTSTLAHLSLHHKEPSNEYTDTTLVLDTNSSKAHSSSDSKTSEEFSHTQEISKQKYDARDDLIANDIQMATTSNTDDMNKTNHSIYANTAHSPGTTSNSTSLSVHHTKPSDYQTSEELPEIFLRNIKIEMKSPSPNYTIPTLVGPFCNVSPSLLCCSPRETTVVRDHNYTFIWK